MTKTNTSWFDGFSPFYITFTLMVGMHLAASTWVHSRAIDARLEIARADCQPTLIEED
jgi:hypothetical protein